MKIILQRFLQNHGNIAIEGNPKSGLCPTLIEWLWGILLVHTIIDSTAHSIHLNSLAHINNLDNIRPTRSVHAA